MAKKPHAIALGRKKGRVRYPAEVAAAPKNGLKGGRPQSEAELLLAEAAELRSRASRLSMKADLLIIRADLLSARAAARPQVPGGSKIRKTSSISSGMVTNFEDSVLAYDSIDFQRRPSAMNKSTESRVRKLRLEIERRLSEARRLTDLAANVRARARQLQKELAQVRRKVGRG
jgi:hypothetical protein